MWQQVVDGERPWMRGVGVEGMHQGGSFQNDPNPGVAMAVDPPFVTLGQAKPALQIEIVSNLFPRPLTHEKAGEKAPHHLGHVTVNRILVTRESIDQFFERLLPLGAGPLSRFEGRGDFLDVLDVLSDRRVLVSHFFESTIDAAGKSAELLFCEPPFCSSTFRWIDSRTSLNASAIRKPGGCSGPP
jgi:hypothetical protein